MDLKEKYDKIMKAVDCFENDLDSHDHEDIADFYQARFDQMEAIASELLSQYGKDTP